MADPPGPTCPNCGNSTMPPGYSFGPTRQPEGLSGLGVAVSVLFGCVAVTQLLAAIVRLAGGPENAKVAVEIIAAVAQVGLIPTFLVWFFKARSNAGLWGPQRHSQGWSIGAWCTPVIFLWFPYQILSDIWRASEPATARRRRGPDAVAVFWWACWILAWVTGASVKNTTTTLPDGTTSQTSGFTIYLGGTAVSSLFAAVAAVLGALVVTRVTRMQEARRPTLR